MKQESIIKHCTRTGLNKNRKAVMSNEIVKFSNQFNNVALKKFDAVHLDVLMTIASRLF